jgi:hypothetical protein
VAIPATDNGMVNANLAELALRFPAGEAARLLPRVTASLDARFGVMDPPGSGGSAATLPTEAGQRTPWP